MRTDQAIRVTPPAGGGNYRGLMQHEAAARLATEGANGLPATKPHTVRAIALDVLREPIFMRLLAACAIYVVLGNLGLILANRSRSLLIVHTLRRPNRAL